MFNVQFSGINSSKFLLLELNIEHSQLNILRSKSVRILLSIKNKKP
jgi:hypothetical protein